MIKDCVKCLATFETPSEHVKMCSSCNKEYRIDKGIQKPDGWVRKTGNMAEYLKEYRKANLEKYKKYEKGRLPRTPEQERVKYERKMKRLHGDSWTPKPLLSVEEKELRRKAMVIYRTARKRGKLIPMPCVVCGEKQVDGHHADYNKPLDVIWLCKPHHQEIHR